MFRTANSNWVLICWDLRQIWFYIHWSLFFVMVFSRDIQSWLVFEFVLLVNYSVSWSSGRKFSAKFSAMDSQWYQGKAQPLMYILQKGHHCRAGQFLICLQVQVIQHSAKGPAGEGGGFWGTYHPHFMWFCLSSILVWIRNMLFKPITPLIILSHAMVHLQKWCWSIETWLLSVEIPLTKALQKRT